MFLLQLLYKLDAQVYPVSLEVDEIKPTAIIGGVEFPGKINQFRKRASNLPQRKRSVTVLAA